MEVVVRKKSSPTSCTSFGILRERCHARKLLHGALSARQLASRCLLELKIQKSIDMAGGQVGGLSELIVKR